MMGLYMTMSFLLHESPADLETLDAGSFASRGISELSMAMPTTVSSEKFRVPAAGKVVLRRTRLLKLLELSIDQYGATLISGRAGSGKTTLASDFVRFRKGSSWFSIDPADSDWSDFCRSIVAALFGESAYDIKLSTKAEPDRSEVSQFVANCFSLLRQGSQAGEQRMIVLDNVHHLFDSAWFTCFFTELITALDDNVRLLILCRSKPNAPLWRMRSKQMLNVIDENLLDFTDTEAKVLSLLHGMPEHVGSEARRRSFGRAGMLAKCLVDLTP